ncbi:MAG: hypothetical protein K2N37_07390 [Lachnospiraceae bacterium]|nr:hypothetical protein [Lachnospiraceae bacterium]
MNGYALLVFFIFAFFGIIVAIFFLLMMLNAAINKNELLAKMAYKLVLVYVGAIGIFIVVEIVRGIWFALIPQLSVDGGQMTIINYGVDQWGSHAIYVCSEEGILEEIDTPHYWHQMTADRKFGYTFASRAAGDLYVVVAEIDCGDLSYADIYDVKVDQDGSIAAEKVENIDIGYNMYRSKIEELLEHLVDEYGFSREVLEENYGYYLNR